MAENKVIVEIEEKKDNVSKIVYATLNIQKRLIDSDPQSQDEINQIIDSMMPELSNKIEKSTMKKITAAIIPSF